MIELDNTMLLFIGSENYSSKQNRINRVSKALGVGSNPTTPAIRMIHTILNSINLALRLLMYHNLLTFK